jgi:hypothetical protein
MAKKPPPQKKKQKPPQAKKQKPAPAKKKPAPKRAKRVTLSGDELLIEELGFARQELKRVANESSAARRELEASLSTERNASERMFSELEAVRIDLKTALADLEIARTEAQREGARAQGFQRELAASLEGQRLAEHAATATREQLYELRREYDRLRAEMKRPETT